MEGDKDAESQFYEKYYRWLVFIIRKRYVESSWVEDIAQEALVVTITSLQDAKVENPDRVLGYLRRTGLRMAARFMTRENKQLLSDPQVLAELEASPENVAAKTEWIDLIECAKQCIDDLTVPRDRDILRRYFVLGAEKGEICRDLNLDSGLFDRVLFRAKGRLRELFTKKHLDGRRE